MEIRRSYDRLISTMGFPILVRWHLYIESAPCLQSQYLNWWWLISLMHICISRPFDLNELIIGSTHRRHSIPDPHMWAMGCLLYRFEGKFTTLFWHHSGDHFVNASSQWRTTLHNNVVSHWLGAYTKWSLHSVFSILFYLKQHRHSLGSFQTKMNVMLNQHWFK